MTALLSAQDFTHVVRHAPLISLDLVVTNSRGEALLGQRLNRPAQGYWFVPGGRVRKDERLAQAFLRLTQEELGLALPLNEAHCLGPYEHHYPDNVFGTDFSTHYVVLAYQLTLDLDLAALPHAQHGAYRWWPLAELRAAPDVHVHTQWYFPA